MDGRYEDARLAAEIFISDNPGTVADRDVRGWNTVIDQLSGAMFMVEPNTDAHAELTWAFHTAQGLRGSAMTREIL